MKKILVVDDEASIAAVLSELLEMEGYDVRIVFSGDEAFAALPQECPDLILTDVMMPGMDGLSLCRKLGQDPQYQHIPVVFMSAVARVSPTSDCHMAAFISKPFDMDTVLQTVARVLAEGHEV